MTLFVGKENAVASVIGGGWGSFTPEVSTVSGGKICKVEGFGAHVKEKSVRTDLGVEGASALRGEVRVKIRRRSKLRPDGEL